jgi:hypothetical protein
MRASCPLLLLQQIGGQLSRGACGPCRGRLRGVGVEGRCWHWQEYLLGCRHLHGNEVKSTML